MQESSVTSIGGLQMIVKGTPLYILQVYLDIKLMKTLMMEGASSGDGKVENHLMMIRTTI